MYLEAN